MRAGAAAVALAIAAAAAGAQDSDPHAAQPERPTVATHAYTIAPGWVEVESGVEFDRLGGLNTFSTPATLKLGLAKRLQIEATTAFVELSGAASAEGMADVVLALKWHVADSVPVLGDFALQPAVRLPTGTAPVGGDNSVASLIVISSNHFGPVEVDINGGLFTRVAASSGVPPLATFWTVSADAELHGPLGWTLEIFGFPGTSGAAGAAPLIGLLTGPTWIVHEWFVLDTGVILPIEGPQPHSLYAGLTWNIGRVWGPPPTAPSR